MSRSSNTPATPVSNPASAQGVPDGWQWRMWNQSAGEMTDWMEGKRQFSPAVAEGLRYEERPLFASPAPSLDATVPAGGGVRAIISRLRATDRDYVDASWIADQLDAALSSAPASSSPAEGEALPAGVDAYDRGRRDMLNSILALNPAVAAKIAHWEEREPDPLGRLPFNVALWVTEVATQLGIEPKDGALSASAPAPEERAVPAEAEAKEGRS